MVRRQLRWRAYDYSRPGAYLVTLVTRGRNPIFGVPTRTGILLTDAGRVVDESWSLVSERFRGVHVDAFVVMPEHVHAIVFLLQTDSRPANLGQVVGWTKQRSSRVIARLASPHPIPIWQTRFHDRVIRDQEALTRMRNYVHANPERAWDDACRLLQRANDRFA